MFDPIEQFVNRFEELQLNLLYNQDTMQRDMEMLRNIVLNRGIQDVCKQMDWSDNNRYGGRASQCTSRYNTIGMDEDFQNNYNIVGIHINQMFQNPFRSGYYYYRENRYGIVVCNVYRHNEEIGLYWMKGSYITMGQYEKNDPTI